MFDPVWSVYICTVFHHPDTEGCRESTAEIELMNSRMIFFWLRCHVPYQIVWTVMLAVRTGPMWYFKWTNSDEPSNFFESPKIASWAFVLLWGHGRHAIVGLRKSSTVTARSAGYRETQHWRILVKSERVWVSLCFWVFIQNRLRNVNQMNWGLYIVGDLNLWFCFRKINFFLFVSVFWNFK